jgi:hypothetical protein
VGVLLLLPTALAGQAIPVSYKIEGVPLYQQVDARGCGAAALQMVFDYYGPFINQMEIYDAARSGGTALPDMARAAQFSNLSTSAGDRFQHWVSTGYPERTLGYAAFYFASATPWLDQLKAIVAQGYPVIVLVNWLPGVYGPHYRVVVGYDDAAGVLRMNDPWSREFKNDMGYQGSTSQSANAWDVDFGTFNMTYADFLSIWSLSTTVWGVPGLAYGAVLVTPWTVQLRAPSTVTAGKTFTVSATVTYPVLAPFGSADFPTFPTSDVQVTLSAGNGLAVLNSASTVLEGTVSAGHAFKVSWTLKAGNTAGAFKFDVTASGLVSGSLGPWHDYPAYAYTDRIGGSASTILSIGS